jgi:membrane fusion protein, copper/silver efflux system
MSRAQWVLPLAAILAVGVGGYWLGHNGVGLPELMTSTSSAQTNRPVSSGPVIYYRDPDDKPIYSLEPKKTPDGRPYRAVLASEDISFDSSTGQAATPGQPGARRILYYRNPMGLPDTSPVPKKDPMGMDYIPVYADEQQDDGKTVRVSLDKVQRSGVRTEAVESRVIVHPVRAVGTVVHDESRLTIVAMRSEGFIEDLFVNKTGQHVHEGEPLFRVYSPEIQKAQIDFLYGLSSTKDGPVQRLRNLGVPEAHIRKVQETRTNLRTVDWLSPVTGDVIDKRIINGQRVNAGDELYRIADHSQLWVIADVAESDLAALKIGTRAVVTVRAYPMQRVEGKITFIYPHLRTETRTARVRIEVPNPDGRLKVEMYADVIFQTGTDETPTIAVPASAIIDSGVRQVVLVAKGEGRFEPRPVKLGRRGDDYVEILEGVTKGEEVVTSATFLIDAESNLKAALQAFTQPEASK